MYNRTQNVSATQTTLHDQSHRYKTFVLPSNTHYTKQVSYATCIAQSGYTLSEE